MKNVTAGRIRGFTLIELLVVVLIIGILASVALPQYNRAVGKARVATTLPVLKNYAEAQKVYYLAHGSYATQLDELDIEIPTEMAGGRCEFAENVMPNGVISCRIPDYLVLTLFLTGDEQVVGKLVVESYDTGNGVANAISSSLLSGMQKDDHTGCGNGNCWNVQFM